MLNRPSQLIPRHGQRKKDVQCDSCCVEMTLFASSSSSCLFVFASVCVC